MSYTYGPTVVSAPFNFAMDGFSNSFVVDQKENSHDFAMTQSKNTSQGSRQVLSNLSNIGCHANIPQESFLVLDDNSCGARVQQGTSTSNRVPLAEKQCSQQPKRQPGTASKPARRNNWTDVDAQNQSNPLACSEYAVSIFEHLHTTELLNRPNPQYVQHVQHELSTHMRCILVDWLVEVAQEYRLTSDTLHLTLNLLDRFLSVESIVREELQLAGIACMWVASKFEEIYAPTARNFCYITDNTYDQQQLVAMEARLLSALNFTLAVPTAKTFQRRYLQAAAADEELHYLAAFLLELTLMDETLLPYLPSQLAAASVYLAHIMLNRKPWSGTLAHYARYSETEVRLVAQELASTHARILTEGQFGAIREKYSSEKLLSVAAVPICQTMLTPQTINFLQLLLSESRDSLSGATGSIDMELV